MNRLLSVFAPITLLSLAASCKHSTDTVTEDIRTIKADQIRWLSDFNSRDLDRMVSHYTEDVVVMEVGTPVRRGRPSVKKMYSEMLADPAYSADFAPSQVEVAKSGDIGYAIGSYTSGMTDPDTKKPILDRGSYIDIYKKQKDGSWKIVADIGASEVLSAPPSSKK
jgi:uncharacterized protein (TIGR02246 family)